MEPAHQQHIDQVCGRHVAAKEGAVVQEAGGGEGEGPGEEEELRALAVVRRVQTTQSCTQLHLGTRGRGEGRV